MRAPLTATLAICLAAAATQAGAAATHAAPGGAEASTRQSHHAPSGQVGHWPAEFLERPIELRSGVGEVHDPVTTPSAEAQAYYAQGLALHYLYTYHDAARSFHQALRLDPDLALAHLGLSLAYDRLGARDRSQAALEEAQARAEAVTEEERLRIELRARALDLRAGRGSREAYRQALDAAVERFPEDTELAMLRAQGTSDHQTRIARLHAVLAIFPSHVGAIHQLVHRHEHAGEFEMAARWGERLANEAPAVPHALHMAGHNFPRIGRLEDAIRVFEAADRLERRYMEEAGLPAWHFRHFQHNLEYLAFARWQQGRAGEALSLLRQAVATESRQGQDAGGFRVFRLVRDTGYALFFLASAPMRGPTAGSWHGHPALHASILGGGTLLFTVLLVAGGLARIREAARRENEPGAIAVGRRALRVTAAAHLAALLWIGILLQGNAASPGSGLAMMPLVALVGLGGGAVAVGVIATLRLWAAGTGSGWLRFRYSLAVLLSALVVWSIHYPALVGHS